MHCAQPNTDPNQFTETALSIAIKQGNLRMVHLVLKFGAHRKHKVRWLWLCFHISQSDVARLHEGIADSRHLATGKIQAPFI